jgi:DNA repair exonuclease SbcCD nuclease subunit
MSLRMLKVLFLSDTHLGFDWPMHERVERRRRGPDFVANMQRALAAAIDERVDLVVHGGDLFHRSRPPAAVVDCAANMLLAVANAGIPVVVVPGNHERSSLPPSLFWYHTHLHVLDRPRQLTLQAGGLRVAVSGFPHTRQVRRAWQQLQQGLPPDPRADVNLMVFHEATEGATVGPADFTFRFGDDVIARAALPNGFDAFLSGHIHRHQQLTAPSGAPVIYPGSIERTSIAEHREHKGYVRIDFASSQAPSVRFVPLPARPMCALVLPALSRAGFGRALADALAPMAPDAVVQLHVDAGASSALEGYAELVRAVAPNTMTIELRLIAAQR